MKSQINVKQLRADLDTLSESDLEAKYPTLRTKSLKGLSAGELEKRISKAEFFHHFKKR